MLTILDEVPGEIYAIIFELTISSERQSSFRIDYEGAETVNTRSLIAISHVCSRWRAIALSTPSLWTRCDTVNRPKLRGFLDRARHAPLSLVLTWGFASSNVDRCRNLMVSRSTRLRRLDIVLRNAAYGDINEVLHFSAPALECLVISQQDQLTVFYPYIRKPQGMKRMRALALAPLAYCMPQGPFPYLAHLYLSFEYDWRGRSAHLLVSLLTGSPALQYLHLSRLHPFAPPLLDINIPLTRLKLLSITNDSDFSSATSLLGCLSLPQTVPIRLDCHANHYFVGTSNLLHIPQLNGESGPSRLDVGFGFKALSLFAEGDKLPSPVWVQAHYDDRDRFIWDNWLTSFATTHFFPSVLRSRLYIDSASSEAFIKLLHRLPYVAELELLLYLNSDVIQYGAAAICALGRICRALSTESTILCPDLRTVRVQIITATPSSTAYVGDLKRMLRARTRLEVPIWSLAVQVIDVASIDKSELESGRSTGVNHVSRDGDAEKTGAYAQSLSETYVDELGPLVCDFQFYAPEGKVFPPRVDIDASWRMEGSEDYWALPEHDLPVLKFPWVN
ncbi:hypothetical protein L226DRAFT_576071 [Lentinus tigrinus ALCF2SS1-7]|uniref:Uncharacterized protein n=1 Tax=Lentinus tigrinus ALCF2SS1-6 TaxID=1328759 RepID=A0A5C2RU97_9APHY|nr:hypothetical protein L227DRAFT_657815 [Lentinus tigrinus ALCF2SS1-6]RPD68900.1 hypothetical protein L226DRAFT_576071 [Lentinus tigrinus ALCF2SS1-7]